MRRREPLLYTTLIGSVALLAAGIILQKPLFERLCDWRSSEGGAGGGGLFEMPPPAKGTSKGAPQPDRLGMGRTIGSTPSPFRGDAGT